MQIISYYFYSGTLFTCAPRVANRIMLDVCEKDLDKVTAMGFTDCKSVSNYTKECNTFATVEDITGFDGCGFIFVLDDGSRLEAQNINELKVYHGQRVKIHFTELNDYYSICMVGKMVHIDCIQEGN